ncbi:hypothetical protein [Methylobacterium currus]|uniref:hyaluronate lyase N-terminal domain-containing protein n=1 Tax=Methylobacterium currus TaxID=2051553 RepID=UPI0013E0A6F4|nr:hypothetical protein [Methylobacterium currus]
MLTGIEVMLATVPNYSVDTNAIRLQFLREAWAFLRTFTGRPGEVAVDTTNNRLVVHDGTTPGGFPTVTAADLKTLQTVTLLGLGTTADAQNPFAAKLNTALWTALTNGEGGSGDLRYTLNKEASGNTLSLLLQSGYSGRAELGLTGDDDLRVKVSPDGSTWREALRIDRATGGLDLTAAEVSAPVAATVDLGALPALKVALTGAGTVTSFGPSPNRVRLLRFTGAATLTHNPASLVLPGRATLVTAAGDTALATSDASGNWTVRDFVRASGKPVTGPASADITDSTATGRALLTAAGAAAGATALGLGTGSAPTFADLTLSGNATVGGGALTLNNAASNSLMFSDSGYAPPSLTARSAGTKIVLYPVNQSSIDYALGIEVGAIWNSVPSATQSFKWYAGLSNIATLSGAGHLTVNGSIRPGSYTVATVPAGAAGGLVYVSNARKAGEAAGSGTGVLACFSNGAWRRLSDETPVAA